MADLAPVWRKSTKSGLDGCVEVALIEGARVALDHARRQLGERCSLSEGVRAQARASSRDSGLRVASAQRGRQAAVRRRCGAGGGFP